MKKFLDLFNEQVLRPILASNKEKLAQAFDIPNSAIAHLIKDAYAQIANATPVNNLNAQIDPAKIEQSVDALKAQLQKPAVSLILAQGIKELVKRNSTESLESAIFSALPNADLESQLVAQIIIAQLENVKTSSVQDVAAQIRTLATKLPSAFVAEQINTQLQDAASQNASKLTAPDLSQLPDADAVADVTKDVGNAISNALDNASKGASFDETLKALKQLPADVNAILARLKGQNNNQPPAAENPAPKEPKKKKGPGQGGSFDI